MKLAALALTLTLSLGLAPGAVAGDTPQSRPLLQSKVYLQISPQGTEDLKELFTTLEESVAADEPQTDPVVIVLHGPEAMAFLRSNYLEHQLLVDQAAKLRAFNRIHMRMCETWMRNNGISRDELLPFVDTVPLAPEEVERLERDGYLPYPQIKQRTTLL